MKIMGVPIRSDTFFLIGLLAGAAGGVAEIMWFAIYAGVSGADTGEVARSVVTVAAFILPISSPSSAPIVTGVAIHMFVSVGLGIALTFASRTLLLRKLAGGDAYLLLPAALMVIWVFNFFVLLPLISPYFDGLNHSFTVVVPYSVSLFSKLLFGLAAATVLRLKRTTGVQSVLIQV